MSDTTSRNLLVQSIRKPQMGDNDYRKDRKKIQETDRGGLQLNTTPAASLFYLAFLYYTVSWEAKPKAIRNIAEIYT